MPTYLRIEFSQCRHCAHAKGKVGKIGMLEADGSRAQVVGGRRKYTGRKDAFEGRVVAVQSLEGISVVLVELGQPGG